MSAYNYINWLWFRSSLRGLKLDYLINSLPSQTYLVATKSTINQNSNHSITIQKGENHSKNVHIISPINISYINNAKTKFIHAHINAHLNQYGIVILNIG